MGLAGKKKGEFLFVFNVDTYLHAHENFLSKKQDTGETRPPYFFDNLLYIHIPLLITVYTHAHAHNLKKEDWR